MNKNNKLCIMKHRKDVLKKWQPGNWQVPKILTMMIKLVVLLVGKKLSSIN